MGSTEKKLIIPDGLGIQRLTDHLLDAVGMDMPHVSGKASLEVIALPTSVDIIGERTFYGQSNVKNLYFQGKEPPSKCGLNAFGAIDFKNMCFCVPVEADIDTFVEALHLDAHEVQFATWDQWNP